MFTGIIEEKGRILKIIRNRVQRIFVQSSLENRIGDSISIQGVCLTVTELYESGFVIEAMEQTKGRTTISKWRQGDWVNLERALQFNGRVGGHFVLGHIDEVGRLIRRTGNEYYFQISAANTRYLIPRGSIAIDGVSLTVGNVSQQIFSVFLIPHTLENTSFGSLKVGAFVNIEYDYLVKIIAKSLMDHLPGKNS